MYCIQYMAGIHVGYNGCGGDTHIIGYQNGFLLHITVVIVGTGDSNSTFFMRMGTSQCLDGWVLFRIFVRV